MQCLEDASLLTADFVPISISGNVFNDLNGNAAADAGEPGLQGWTVQVVDASDTVVGSATTDATGNYEIDGIGPGTMTIREVTQAGWAQTAPTPVPPGNYTITTTSGVDFTGEDFGNFQTVSVTGNVSNDLNGNAAADAGEPGLQGWTVQVVDATDTVVGSATTDATGNYEIDGIGPGTMTVREVAQAGWTQTAPAPVPPGTYTFTTSSGTNVSGEAFGNFQNVSVTGNVFNDLNGNAAADAGEPGLQGWTVQVVNASNAVVGSATTDATGNYEIDGIGPGTMTVREVAQAGWTQTAPAPVPPGTYTFTTSSGTNLAGETFGNFQNVSVTGNVFNDLNGNAAQNAGEPGLQGWTVQVVNASNAVVGSATTDATGNYTIPGIGPGTLTVREVAQAGWTQTAPAPIPPGTYTFTTSSGTNLAGETFGNFQNVTVTGNLFNDLNGNAAADAGEPGLQGWTVQVVNASNAVVGSATTDASGNYTIPGIGPAR